MRWQRGPLKVVILTKTVMLTKIARNPQRLPCKSNEEVKGPLKSGEYDEKLPKFAKALYRSHEIDEFGENAQRVNL